MHVCVFDDGWNDGGRILNQRIETTRSLTPGTATYATAPRDRSRARRRPWYPQLIPHWQHAAGRGGITNYRQPE